MMLIAWANFVSGTKIWQVPAFCLLRAGKIIAKAKVIQTARSKMGTMAENHAQPVSHPAVDCAEDEKTYRLFRQLMKYGAAIVLALLALFCG
jgi:Bacterial aa3 type cytochrome c oxidase subunit IV